MNVNKTCRICLSASNTMINIFSKRDFGTISSKIMSISKAQVSSQGMLCYFKKYISNLNIKI